MLFLMSLSSAELQDVGLMNSTKNVFTQLLLFPKLGDVDQIIIFYTQDAIVRFLSAKLFTAMINDHASYKRYYISKYYTGQVKLLILLRLAHLRGFGIRHTTVRRPG